MRKPVAYGPVGAQAERDEAADALETQCTEGAEAKELVDKLIRNARLGADMTDYIVRAENSRLQGQADHYKALYDGIKKALDSASTRREET